MLIALLCMLLCACLLLTLRKRPHAHELPPAYYKSLPIIGITHLLLTDTAKFWLFVKSMTEDTIKQGGVTWTRVGTDIHYFITDPEDAMTVANTCLDKHPMYRIGECIMGQGLITGPVSMWQRHRKLLKPAFALPTIHSFLEIFNRQTEALINKFDYYADKGPFDPSLDIQNISVRTSCLTAFGTTCLHDKDYLEQYVTSFHELMNIFMQRFQNVWQHSDLLFRLSGLKNKQDKLAETFSEMTNRIIKMALRKKQNYRNLVDNATGAASFLETLLPLLENNLLSEKQLKEELDTTVCAGFETSAQTLQIMLAYLGSHPKVQELLYEEIERVVGLEKDISKDDLTKLVYTEAVIKETLRVVPVVPFLPRYVRHDVKLKNYTLRAGSQCILFATGINRDAVWGPDADEFKPERWLHPDTLPDVASAFAGFSIGKRNCIGKTYALTSLKVSLVHLVRKYRVMADHTKLQFNLDVTMRTVGGHEISLQRRTMNVV